MSLDFHDHLLQAPNGLLAALLGHLPLEVVVEASTTLLGLVLGVIKPLLGVLGHIAAGLVTEGAGGSVSAPNRVDAGLPASLRVVGSEIGSSCRVALTAGVSFLGGVASSLLEVVLAEGLVLVVDVLEPVLRKIGSLVPRVVRGRLVNLPQPLIVRAKLVRGIGSGIAAN